jgi:hypothetical protein
MQPLASGHSPRFVVSTAVQVPVLQQPGVDARELGAGCSVDRGRSLQGALGRGAHSGYPADGLPRRWQDHATQSHPLCRPRTAACGKWAGEAGGTRKRGLLNDP